jgi:hypothetical protein
LLHSQPSSPMNTHERAQSLTRTIDNRERICGQTTSPSSAATTTSAIEARRDVAFAIVNAFRVAKRTARCVARQPIARVAPDESPCTRNRLGRRKGVGATLHKPAMMIQLDAVRVVQWECAESGDLVDRAAVDSRWQFLRLIAHKRNACLSSRCAVHLDGGSVDVEIGRIVW